MPSSIGEPETLLQNQSLRRIGGWKGLDAGLCQPFLKDLSARLQSIHPHREGRPQVVLLAHLPGHIRPELTHPALDHPQRMGQDLNDVFDGLFFKRGKIFPIFVAGDRPENGVGESGNFFAFEGCFGQTDRFVDRCERGNAVHE